MSINVQFHDQAPPRQDLDFIDKSILVVIEIYLEHFAGNGRERPVQNGFERQDVAFAPRFPHPLLIVVTVAPAPAMAIGKRCAARSEQAHSYDGYAGKDEGHRQSQRLNRVLSFAEADGKLTVRAGPLSAAIRQDPAQGRQPGLMQAKDISMQISKSLLAASALLASAGTFGAGAALAEPAQFDIGSNPSAADVRGYLTDQGFDVREIEFYSRKIEVKGFDASGRCMEIYFHPSTGEELRREHDDDCGRRSQSDDDWDDDDYHRGRDRSRSGG